MKEIIYKIIHCYNPERCIHCLSKKTKNGYSDYHDGQGILLEEEILCGNCGELKDYYAYGSYTNPLVYIDSFIERLRFTFIKDYNPFN